MGVPKLFRWLSERYPLCSELIGKNRIPEFDNLYLDMNGIIHNCSHPNDDDPMFRITETQIFLAIFGYIDNIFSTIKPKKIFMLAVDGVAPRAKMNQQRARRFRAAMEAKENAEKAERAGKVLPTDAAFDSNCITPGTPFMDRLQTQLKYYINKKISEDSAWRDVTVILSGHDVPGEGEHKIMEFIRNSKAAPNYENNVRHCLYGLDADLMMLGLLSHEPHFSLLREEVTFGRKPKRSTKSADEQNFFLLHLSLLREYLSFEFIGLSEKVSFQYDFERVLDDFVLMCFFVGNDFLPHLPGLHINEGGLVTLFDIYKEILPQCKGYLNENGYLNLAYCQLFFEKLEEVEIQEFREFQGDSSWMKGKKRNNSSNSPPKPKLCMTKSQLNIYESIKIFLEELRTDDNNHIRFNWSKMPAGDRAFTVELVNSLGLAHNVESGDVAMDLIISWNELDDEFDEESAEAQRRILRKYDLAERAVDRSSEEMAAVKEMEFSDAMLSWKKDYYREKLEIASDYENKVSKIVFSYVEGLQWVLLYYYHGVQSWEWFFPYHYSPKISDLTKISGLKFNLIMGSPFSPFDQLMAVLPPLSRQHVPTSLQDLMIDIHSPIIDFYPAQFELDMNGKKASWEAIVKIPFIDEKRLLKAIRARQNMLSSEEKRRNARGNPWLFHYESSVLTQYPSPDPVSFPDIFNCASAMVAFIPIQKGNDVSVNHLCPNALLGKDMMPGFPSIYTIPFTTTLGFHGVNVFNSESKNQSQVISLQNVFEDVTPENVALSLIGSSVFTSWPFLIEARVLSLSDEYFFYEKRNLNGVETIIKTPHNDSSIARFAISVEKAEKYYSKRFGVLTGVIEMCAKLETLVGLQLLNDGSLVKEFKVLGDSDTPVQLLVLGDHFDHRFDPQPCPPIWIEFPPGSPVFFLAPKLYGTLCEIVPLEETVEDFVNLKIMRVSDPSLQDEPTIGSEMARIEQLQLQYFPGWQLAKRLKSTAIALSRITSSVQVTIGTTGQQKMNIGLCLKFDSKALKVLGYSRKSEKGWEYTQKAMTLIEEYRRVFPSIFARLENPSSSDFYKDTDFFPSSTKENMERVQKWLQEKGIKHLLAVPQGSITLTKESVEKIESVINKYCERLSQASFEPMVINSVPRKNILKPAHAAFRLSHQTFELGDRVINAVDFGRVPIGVKGVVIGIDGNLLDIIWDLLIMGAGNLDGLCSRDRGCTVEKDTLINLSRIQPPFSVTAPRQTPSKAKNSSGASFRRSEQPPPRPSQWTGSVPVIKNNGNISQEPQVAFRPADAGSWRARPQVMASQHPYNAAPPSMNGHPHAGNQTKEMEDMLKSMLHIGGGGNETDSSMGHSQQAWRPPTLMMQNGPPIMNIPEFVPNGPISYLPSWTPSIPITPSSIQPITAPQEEYDEMANRLLSILKNQKNQGSGKAVPVAEHHSLEQQQHQLQQQHQPQQQEQRKQKQIQKKHQKQQQNVREQEQEKPPPQQQPAVVGAGASKKFVLTKKPK